MTLKHPEIIIDSLENGVMIVDEAFVVHYWNRWLQLSTEIPAEAIVGKSLREFFDEIDYRVLGRKIHTTLHLNSPTFYFSKGERQFFRIPRHVVSDSTVPAMRLKVTISPYEEDQVVVLIQDVSALEEFRLELQTMTDRLAQDKEIIDHNLMLLKIDATFCIVEASWALCHVFECREEDLLGQHINVLFHEALAESLEHDIRLKLAEDEKWYGEIKSAQIGDKAFWFDVIITPDSVRSDRSADSIVIFNDISDKKRIERLAITDPLTKLYNRGHFDSEIERNVAFDRRKNERFSLIILDIDHFKRVNDTYGHQAGDLVLKELATILTETLRQTDVIARWGGEEFVILLPGTDLSIGVPVAEKLRVAVQDHHFEEVGKITCSFGVSAGAHGERKEDLIARADEALYQAKADGRNRVCSREA